MSIFLECVWGWIIVFFGYIALRIFKKNNLIDRILIMEGPRSLDAKESENFLIESEYIDSKKVELMKLLDDSRKLDENHLLFDTLTWIYAYIELIGFTYATRYWQEYSKMLTQTMWKLNQIIQNYKKWINKDISFTKIWEVEETFLQELQKFGNIKEDPDVLSKVVQTHEAFSYLYKKLLYSLDENEKYSYQEVTNSQIKTNMEELASNITKCIWFYWIDFGCRKNEVCDFDVQENYDNWNSFGYGIYCLNVWKWFDIDFEVENNTSWNLKLPVVLKHIIDELITNWIKYSNPSNKIKINIYQDDESTKIEAIDNWIWIPEEKQIASFKKNVSLNSGDEITRYGFGLYWIYQEIQQLGWEVFIKSKEWVGTKITLVF